MKNALLNLLVAVAIAIALSPPSQLQAAAYINPGSQPETKNLAHVVKAKGKKKAKKKGKHAKSKGPGMCGTNMYYSKKSAQMYGRAR